MDKLLDPSFWETSWKTFSSAPEIAIPVLILVGGVVWWIRGVVNGREISGRGAHTDVSRPRGTPAPTVQRRTSRCAG